MKKLYYVMILLSLVMLTACDTLIDSHQMVVMPSIKFNTTRTSIASSSVTMIIVADTHIVINTFGFDCVDIKKVKNIYSTVALLDTMDKE